MGYCFPYQTHRCYCRLNDLHSVVFHYGISTYFALPHTFPIVSTMGMVWLGSIPKPSPTTMGLLRISHHSLAFPYHPSVLLPLWDCYGLQSTIPSPYHPSLLLLMWDCYGLKTTIPFPYYLSILLLVWEYCYRSQSTISLPYHPDCYLIWEWYMNPASFFLYAAKTALSVLCCTVLVYIEQGKFL